MSMKALICCKCDKVIGYRDVEGMEIGLFSSKEPKTYCVSCKKKRKDD